MNIEADSPTKLREEARLGRQIALQRSPNQSSCPQIKMFVSYWYTDEFGNQTRSSKRESRRGTAAAAPGIFSRSPRQCLNLNADSVSAGCPRSNIASGSRGSRDAMAESHKVLPFFQKAACLCVSSHCAQATEHSVS
jgi:hypothetical protein